MKNITKFFIYTIVLVLVFIYRTEISTFILKKFVFKNEIVLQEINEYRILENFEHVSYKYDFYAKTESDLYNIIYTVINNGWNNFSFYCDDSYKECLTDVDNLINNPYQLSYINNFVHPYNAYDKIRINYTNLGRIEVIVEKLYTEEEIYLLNNKVTEISNKLFTSKMSLESKIKAVHNYIIKNTKYDNDRATAILNKETFVSENSSHKAIGPLIEGLGICGGYSDAMALFLNKLNVKNYRVSNTSHIWNFVNLDNTWYHLDLTWDDPVVNTGEDVLLDTYYLITTKELKKLEDGKHTYDENVFKEAK